MKTYLIAGASAATLILAASGSAWAGAAVGGLNALGIQAVSNSELSNNSVQVSVLSGNGAIANQGILYGSQTFQNMGGVNSNGLGTNGGTGQSLVSVTAAGVINILNP